MTSAVYRPELQPRSTAMPVRARRIESESRSTAMPASLRPAPTTSRSLAMTLPVEVRTPVSSLERGVRRAPRDWRPAASVRARRGRSPARGTRRREVPMLTAQRPSDQSWPPALVGASGGALAGASAGASLPVRGSGRRPLLVGDLALSCGCDIYGCVVFS